MYHPFPIDTVTAPGIYYAVSGDGAPIMHIVAGRSLREALEDAAAHGDLALMWFHTEEEAFYQWVSELTWLDDQPQKGAAL